MELIKIIHKIVDHVSCSIKEYDVSLDPYRPRNANHTIELTPVLSPQRRNRCIFTASVLNLRRFPSSKNSMPRAQLLLKRENSEA